MIFVGMDPGVTGGIAIIDHQSIELMKMSDTTPGEIADVLWKLGPDVSCVIEKVGAGPRMASSAAFKFGKSAGILEGLVITSNIPYDLVTPQKWQKHFGLIRKGMSFGDSRKKKLNREKAQALYPSLRKKIVNGTADALLIATYARDLEEGGTE